MKNKKNNYDIIVIGAGHAGCEAALCSARMGCQTLLLTIDLDKIASMPCSPSIGGMAKGQLVKELDALGGEMGKIADLSAIQYKTLNTKKGPAVQSTRTQNDKSEYHIQMKAIIENQPGLDLKQGMIDELLVEDNRVRGVIDQTGYSYFSKAVILAAGTFFCGLVHIGFSTYAAGRAGEFASHRLPQQLKKLGLSLGRMKTGTPPRLDRSSIDFSQFQKQAIDTNTNPFSMFTDTTPLPKLPCYIGHTNLNSHHIIRNNLKASALYGGPIKGVSARYCPSFEDKIVKFPEREQHQIILEPEGVHTQEVYASGLGNSMPMEIQEKFVQSIKGLEEAQIMRPGYAIEYDYINPIQLHATLETKKIEGLFLAGQINGTSGYEEAAAQGLWAGVNAALNIQKRPPFILDRSQAYMAVMVDDLITRGTNEPYRMFTSRAEYRLMLREDNADLRLSEIGFKLGLIDERTIDDIRYYKKMIKQELKRIKSTHIGPEKKVNHYLMKHNSPIISDGISLSQLLKRAELSYDTVDQLAQSPYEITAKMAVQIQIETKYEGYIKKQLNEIEKFKQLEKMMIPHSFKFLKLSNLSNEIKEKLEKIRPQTLGQASRIEGMTPAAISVLMIALKAGHSRI